MALNPLQEIPQKPLKIKRALISVSDKTGLIPFVKILHQHGVELISTGGTAKTIRNAGVKVTDITEITGFPECLDGRVKTLHPHVHGSILGRTSYQPDLDELNKLNIRPIELVVVNLYPFQETVAEPGVTPEIATENIDIGGPTMIRAAAKNFAHVCAVCSPDQYKTVQTELENDGAISFESRKKLALEAFRHTASYDVAVSNYFSTLANEKLPGEWSISLKKTGDLRYGENPHQSAAVYGRQNEWFDCFHGKDLSYNNYLDVDAAINLMADFTDKDPTVAIFKHTVPCGVASSSSLQEAYQNAFSTDSVSPFGGIVIVNRELDLDTARAVDKIFTEIILAPSFSSDALKFLKEKKNRRLIRVKKYPSLADNKYQFRSVVGGALIQQPDLIQQDPQTYKTVTRRNATKSEWDDLLFAWKIVKHVKSNAIVYVKNKQTKGIGTGQTSRVDSSEIAVRKAKKEGLPLEGSVVASDAFFPFPDGIEAAAKAGVKAVIQPGGSIRDKEVIQAADKLELAMIFTGIRHFKH